MEISELNRIIRHEEKLLDFMGTKNQDRTFLETDNERLSTITRYQTQLQFENIIILKSVFVIDYTQLVTRSIRVSKRAEFG